MALFNFNRHGKKRNASQKPDAKELQKELTQAVIKNDLDGVRRVLDTAFWAKLDDVRPDGFHLLIAAQRDNRPLAQLLVTHGAKWTGEEARIVRLSVDKEKLDHLDTVFKAGDINTHFSTEQLRHYDFMTALHWSLRIKQLTKDERLVFGYDDKLLSGILREAERNPFAIGFLTGQERKFDKVIEFLDPALGDGTRNNPLDVRYDFLRLLAVTNTKTALSFLDTMRAEGFAVKPIEVEGFSLRRHPEAIAGLRARGLLAQTNPRRLELLEDWSTLQEKVEWSGRPFTHSPEYVAERHAALDDAAGYLFGRRQPLSEREAEKFIALHERRAAVTPQGLARMEAALIKHDFFTGDAWTPERLKRLAATPLQGSDICETFGKMALAKEIAQNGFDAYLNKKRFDKLAEAIERDAIRPDARVTTRVLRYLKDCLRRDEVTEDIEKVVKTLYEKGADCSWLDPMEFLGKRGPGLAKTLLDTGLVYAENFDLQQVIARTGGGLQLVTPPGGKHYDYTEFACQLILEIAEPAKYVALHDKSAKGAKEKDGEGNELGYQQLFIREWMSNLSLKNGVITYRRRRPGESPSSEAPSKRPLKSPRRTYGRGPRPGY